MADLNNGVCSSDLCGGKRGCDSECWCLRRVYDWWSEASQNLWQKV